MWSGKLKNNPVILDTHTWYWLMAKFDRVNRPKIINRITDAQDNGNLYISVITIWEIGMLQFKQRIGIHQNINSWVDTALRRSHILVLPLHPEIALNSSNLPGNLHGDPADRIIIASTMYIQGTLITADTRLVQYCKKQKISCLPIK